jgi:hypothetical protein
MRKGCRVKGLQKAGVCASGRERERERERESASASSTHTHTQYVCKYRTVLVLFFLYLSSYMGGHRERAAEQTIKKGLQTFSVCRKADGSTLSAPDRLSQQAQYI